MRPADVTRPARLADLEVDPRGYPIIAVVPQDRDGVDFGQLSERRKLVLAAFDLCAVCAKPFGEELRWQVAFDHHDVTDGAAFAEAPVHEVCALYAAQVCPFVSSPYARLGDEMRKGQGRPATLLLIGFDRTDAVRATESAEQAAHVLGFRMGRVLTRHVLRSATDARAAYATALAAEQPLTLHPTEQQIVELLLHPAADGSDSGRGAAGAALLVGGAFCPGVTEVVGLRGYDAPFYEAAAAYLSDPAHFEGRSSSDEWFTAALSWMRERPRQSHVLERWRRHGRTALALYRAEAESGLRGSGPAPRRSDAAKRRKQQRASRRRNRR